MNSPEQRHCETCAYFHVAPQPIYSIYGECRRHAPHPHNWLRFHEAELLRDIAWTLRVIGKVEEPSERDDLATEATEVMHSATWPEVEPTDWCGDWREGPSK